MLRSCLATFYYKALWRSHMANLQHRAAGACQCWRMVASGRRGPPRGFWQSALRGVRIAPSYCLCTTSTTLETARSYFPCSDLELAPPWPPLAPPGPPWRPLAPPGPPYPLPALIPWALWPALAPPWLPLAPPGPPGPPWHPLAAPWPGVTRVTRVTRPRVTPFSAERA